MQTSLATYLATCAWRQLPATQHLADLQSRASARHPRASFPSQGLPSMGTGHHRHEQQASTLPCTSAAGPRLSCAIRFRSQQAGNRRSSPQLHNETVENGCVSSHLGGSASNPFATTTSSKGSTATLLAGSSLVLKVQRNWRVRRRRA